MSDPRVTTDRGAMVRCIAQAIHDSLSESAELWEELDEDARSMFLDAAQHVETWLAEDGFQIEKAAR